MRKPFIAGNWKMNLMPTEAATLAGLIAEAANGVEVEVGLAPTFVAIPAVAKALAGSDVRLTAQNVHWEDSGAYTAEISAPMVKALGVTHVIIGHSERRQLFGETDETVNRRLKAVYAHGLTPILCIGETLEQREADQTLAVNESQLKGALDGIDAASATSIVIAYEPVWAIGTGKTATPEMAQEVHAFIRKTLAGLYSQELADGVRIQYGGSVKPANVKELMAMPDVDGALVGGAALKSESFIPLIKFQE